MEGLNPIKLDKLINSVLRSRMLLQIDYYPVKAVFDLTATAITYTDNKLQVKDYQNFDQTFYLPLSETYLSELQYGFLLKYRDYCLVFIKPLEFETQLRSTFLDRSIYIRVDREATEDYDTLWYYMDNVEQLRFIPWQIKGQLVMELVVTNAEDYIRLSLPNPTYQYQEEGYVFHCHNDLVVALSRWKQDEIFSELEGEPAGKQER